MITGWKVRQAVMCVARTGVEQRIGGRDGPPRPVELDADFGCGDL